jgi:hypothetical protein
MDESTIRNIEAVLMAYVRYTDNGEFTEEVLFCEALKTNTTAIDIYNKLKNYLDEAQISMKNITSCATDGAPVMMTKKRGPIKLIIGTNPKMLLVHCVIHRENVVSNRLLPALNKILNSVIKPINTIKANSKCERLSKQFCEDVSTDHARLLLDTEVSWLSQGNCLRRFMEFFDILSEFLNDKLEMEILQTLDAEAFVSYLTDIFEKLNMLNKQLQGKSKALVDAKAKTFVFTAFLQLCQNNVSIRKQIYQFYWLNKCQITDTPILVTADHLSKMACDLSDRFSDLKEIEFPSWINQPVLVDLTLMATQYQGKLSEMQNDESIRILFNIYNEQWHGFVRRQKRNTLIQLSFARKLLLPFPLVIFS